MTSPAGDQPTKAPNAIYLNKRAVDSIELSLAHTLVDHHDGWRIDFTERGRIRIVMAHGHHQQVDVRPDDFLLSSGEDLYLSLSQGQTEFDSDRTAKEERTRKKQEAREQATAKPGKASKRPRATKRGAS